MIFSYHPLFIVTKKSDSVRRVWYFWLGIQIFVIVVVYLAKERVSLKDSHQVCQMSNIWYLTHQIPKSHSHKVFINAKIFDMSEQHNKNCKSFIFFILFSLSSLLSHHFILFSLISHSSSYIPINLSSFLLSLFFLLSYCFSLFLSASPRHLLDLMPISIAVGFFFFFSQWFDQCVW